MQAARVVEQIATWIRRQIEEAGAEVAVLGLSGGIDSSVTAALCKRALGDAVLGLWMPCGNHPQDRADAFQVADLLGLEMIEVGLEPVYEALLQVLPEGSALARANLKPRLRMLTLYYIANSLNGLVVGTGNKSELAVGYFTKYGDGGVDLLPLGDLTKHQVRELAMYLGLPERILRKPPSAGLWPGQTDEGELGLTYAELDAAIAYLEGDRQAQVSPEVLERVRHLRAASAHKRALPPICRIDPDLL